MKEYVIYGKPSYGGKLIDSEIPKPGPNEVLIKVVAAGLNPKDWKWTKSRDVSGALNAGDDVAGTVASAGASVSEFTPGARVAAFHVMGAPHGGYAEYAVAPASTTFHLPASVSFEAAAGLPLSFMTAALALHQYIGIPLPWANPEDEGVKEAKERPLLIYGGATAVGAYAIQLARLSGIKTVITVAGSGAEFVRGLDPATTIVDYRKGDVAADVLAALPAGTKLVHAFDAVSGKRSYAHVTEALMKSNGGGHINMVDPPVSDGDAEWKFPSQIKFTRTFVASAYGAKHDMISQDQADKDGEFAFVFYRYLGRLLEQGKFKPHPVEVLPGGLEGIVAGIQALYEGKVSAKKLVVQV